jgi:hypothetical protein
MLFSADKITVVIMICFSLILQISFIESTDYDRDFELDNNPLSGKVLRVLVVHVILKFFYFIIYLNKVG